MKADRAAAGAGQCASMMAALGVLH